MTMKLTLAFAVISAFSAFSNELTIPPQPAIGYQEMKTLPNEALSKYELNKQKLSRKGSFYFRAMTDAEPAQQLAVFPGYGIGYRRSFGNSGVDISANYSGSKGAVERTFWTFPKVSYLHYFDSLADSSLYGGAGLAWGVTSSETEDELNDSAFVGLIPHVTVGYELLRHSIIFTFAEFTLSHPLLPNYQEGANPGLIGELSIGAGF